MKIFKKVLLIVLAVILTAAAVLGIWGFVIPAAKVNKLEGLSMADSATAEYVKYLPDADTIYGYAQELFDMGIRLPGTEAGKKAQTYVKDKFTEFGLSDVDIIPSNSKLYICDSYSLTVNGTDMESCYINYSGVDGSFGAFEADAAGEMVYVGSDTASTVDVKGKIVVADVGFQAIPYTACNYIGYLKYDPNNTFGLTESKDVVYIGDSFTDGYFYYMEQGAAGYIGILTDYYDTAEYYSEDYTYYGDMTIPGVWVSNSTGEEIKSAVKNGNAFAEINMSGTLEQIDAGAVIGYVKGQSDETIMVQCHYDSITAGAVEDASGMSCMLALAEMYSQIPSEALAKSVLFIATDTHFSDYDTHDAVVEKLFGDDSSIIANLTIEHICKEYKIANDGSIYDTGNIDTRVVFVSGSDTLINIVNEEFVRHGMDRTVVLPANLLGDSLCTDADEFYQEGIPLCNLISAPVYLYSSDDTMDKIPKEALVPTCETFSDILWRFMNTPSDELSK